MADGLEQLDHRAAGEGALAVEGLVERHAKGELIAARVGGQTLKELARHVAGRAHDGAGLGQAGQGGELAQDLELLVGAAHAGARIAAGGRLVHLGARQAEVHHLDDPGLVDHHVVGLEVAVDEARPVGGGQSAARLAEHAQDLGPRSQARVRLHPRAQRPASDELYRNEQALVVHAHVVHPHDVAVVEAREGLGLPLQAPARRSLVLAAGLEQLERDLAVEVGVVGGVDDPHGPGAELLEHLVAADVAAGDDVPGRATRAALVGQLVRDDEAALFVDGLAPVVGHPGAL